MSFHESRVGKRLAAVAMLVAAVFLQTTRADAAGMLIADGGLGGVLTIEEHSAQVTINNGIAVTEVTQVFRNTENRQVEALYLFPVPEGATVANFSMWIDGVEMIGEVVEKERAREIYNSYKEQRRDPGLLEQVDFKNFEMRIFPIAAGGQQRVEIAYYQELKYDHDWATFVYPLATSPRAGLDAQVSGAFSLSMHVKSAVPIVKCESPSHGDDFVFVQHSDNYVEASLETEGASLSRDLVLSYHVSRPQTGIDLIASRDGEEDGYFLLTLTAGEELAETYDGEDYVFLLDVSGSMANDGKLRVSRESIDAFVRSLDAEDRFEIVTFNVAPNKLFGQLRPAEQPSIDSAIRFLESRQGRGGTVLRPAMSLAYEYADDDRPLNVVILSDGMTRQQERRELLASIQARPSGTRVFCVGVGNEVNRPLLSQLADEAGGLSAFLSAGDDFERQAEAFRRKLTRPAATNVNISFSGGEVYDVEPRKLPNLYHGMPVRLYGRYRTAGEIDVQVDAEINGAPLSQTVSLELPKVETVNTEIERMWALARVNALLRDAERSGNRDAVRDEIVALGEGYSIVTEFTSFLVLENDAEYQRWNIDRKNLLRLGRDRRGQEEVRQQLEQLRDRARAGLEPQKPAPANNAVAANDQTEANEPKWRLPRSTKNKPRSRNLDFGPQRQSQPSGGGGAIDPLSGAIVGALGALSALARRRRKTFRSADDVGTEGGA